MSSETFVSAMLLITGVVAAAILIVAVLPVIWGMVGTFSSASAATDRSMRTDFKIVTTYGKVISLTGVNVTVWMKNVGTARIGKTEIDQADVYVGTTSGTVSSTMIYRGRVNSVPMKTPADTRWWYTLWDITPPGTLNVWEPGETLQVDAYFPYTPAWVPGTVISFQFTVPSGVSRSAEFTAS